MSRVDEANKGRSGHKSQDGYGRRSVTLARTAAAVASLPIVFGVVVFLHPDHAVLELGSSVQWIIFVLVTASSALLLAWMRRGGAYALAILWFAELACVVVLYCSLWRPLLACGIGCVVVLMSLLMQAPRADHAGRSYPAALIAGTLTVLLCVCVAVGHIWFGSLTAAWASANTERAIVSSGANGAR